jgi:hypothetical protein
MEGGGCKHLLPQEEGAEPGLRCTAFPHGVPDSILWKGVKHNEPVEGDGGTQYEPLSLFDTMIGG